MGVKGCDNFRSDAELGVPTLSLPLEQYTYGVFL
jgi:hypothetical protein